uniref:Thioredoxin domain-containing protein n=1 Tax=Moumouvirus sp. 'Monve' TaxID=1128131 RepID=H2EEA3_9VIRU|nr:thioredoxin domain-containing protein [Moumouvirus Monve]
MANITNNPLNVYLDEITSLKNAFFNGYNNKNNNDSDNLLRRMRIIHGNAIREYTLLNSRIAQRDTVTEDDLITLSVSDNLLDAIRKKINHSIIKYHENINNKQNQINQVTQPTNTTPKVNTGNYRIRSNGNVDELSISVPDTETNFQNTRTAIQTAVGGENNSTMTDMINNLNTEQADSLLSRYQTRDNFGTNNTNNLNNNSNNNNIGTMTGNIGDMNNQSGGADPIDVTKPVLVNYYADWCGVSRRFLPTWNKARESFREKYPNLVVRDVNMKRDDPDVKELQGMASKLGVQGYPTLVLYKDGNTESRIAGNMTVADIHNFIDAKLRD